MIKKLLISLLLTSFLMTAAAGAQTLYVDNRETDKVFPERLNLRAEPSSDGDLLGLFYSGTAVETVDEETVGYVKVDIAGVVGYMAKDYLITYDEAVARYGEDGGFFAGRAAQVDLSGLWTSTLDLSSRLDDQAQPLEPLKHGERVELLGIIADDWAYVAIDRGSEKQNGFVPLDALTDVDEHRALVIAGEKADSRVILYSWPNTKAKQLMSLKNGTTCFNLFARSVGGWRKVRVGGVTGWIREMYNPSFKLLSETDRGSIPYYPLQMQAAGDVLLCSEAGDVSKPYMTLGKGMKVEVLAECENAVYVRTMEGSAGAYDCGDYGYVAIRDLELTPAGSLVALAQVDDGDLPAVVLAKPDKGADLVGALCPGAQVRVTDLTQTDYAQVIFGDGKTGYVLKECLTLLTGHDGELSDRIPQRASLTKETALNDAADEDAEAIKTLASGDRVYMFGVIDGMAYVRADATPTLDINDPSGDMTGFVDLAALSAPASTTHLTAFVNTDKVNMRDKGASSGGIIGKARLGERLRVADYGVEWSCVVKPDGTRGFVMTKYLDFEQK